MQNSIKVENLSKLYRIGEIGTGTLSRDVQRWFTTQVLGKEDPFLKIGQTNDRTILSDNTIVYSLRDINFEIQQGDTIGIIGRNGAGKSTLLKILSRVTSPTTGKVNIKGRVASLLEVGTGFHPELTGRENIYLNGAILGMRKREITRKMEEIVDFSGVTRYIDTPVKRYSSGMYVRLAFAVAAHLDSEILIVDEVLAVGDAEFQKKCLGKMGDVSKGEGRTVLFVSHNMASVKALCNNGILLENGLIKSTGDVDTVVTRYLGGDTSLGNYRVLNQENRGFMLSDISICNENVGHDTPISRDKGIHLTLNFQNNTNDPDIFINLKFKDEAGNFFLVTTSTIEKGFIRQGKGTAVMKIPASFLNEGTISIDTMILSKNESGYHNYLLEKDILTVQILPEKRPLGAWMGKEVGYVTPQFEWQINP